MMLHLLLNYSQSENNVFWSKLLRGYMNVSIAVGKKQFIKGCFFTIVVLGRVNYHAVRDTVKWMNIIRSDWNSKAFKIEGLSFVFKIVIMLKDWEIFSPSVLPCNVIFTATIIATMARRGNWYVSGSCRQWKPCGQMVSYNCRYLDNHVLYCIGGYSQNGLQYNCNKIAGNFSLQVFVYLLLDGEPKYFHCTGSPIHSGVTFSEKENISEVYC